MMHKLTVKHFLLSLLFLLNNFAFAQSQNISVSQLPILDQLPSNSVQRIFQDKDGYLWLGTLDGLCRYDAYKIHVFRSDLNRPNLLTNNEITCIAEDKNDNLLIGTKEGLNILNKKTYQITHFQDTTILRKNIRSIIVATDSCIWVGAKNEVYRYNPDFSLKKCYRYNSENKNSLPDNGINSIYEDFYGNIWVAMWKAGLHLYQKKDDQFIRFPKIGKKDNPFKIYQDKQKNYWVCTWGDGLYRFSPNSNKQSIYTKQELLQTSLKKTETKFFSIVQDDINGYIWAMSMSGLHAFEYSEKQQFKEVDISSHFKQTNNIFSEINKGRDGNLWIGAFSEGAFTINFNTPTIGNFPINAIQQSLGVSPNFTTIYEDEDGMLWLNQNRLGLCLFNPSAKQFKFFSEYPELKDILNLKNIKFINSPDNSDEIWIGSYVESEIIKIKKQDDNLIVTETIDLSTICTNPGLPVIFFEDAKNNIWIGTTTSVFIKPYDSNNFKLIANNIGTVAAISQDTKGTIWIGCQNSGIYSIPQNYNSQTNKLTLTHLEEDSKVFMSHNIQSLDTDKKGNLWIGTKEGCVLKYNNISKSFTDQTQVCAQIGEAILDIVVDRFDHVWISTNKRITEFNPQNGASYCFNTSNDTQVNSFLTHSFFKAKNSDKIYFGGNKGYNYFVPSSRLSLPKKKSSVLVTDIKIQNQSILNSNSNNKFNFKNNHLVLSPKDKNIEINFSSLNFSNPSKIKYAYQLEGVDEDWIYVRNNRQFAIYSQLQKGDYSFKIKCSDSHSLWSKIVTNVSIQRKPAIYETIWAYLIYTFLIIAILIVSIIIILSRLKLRNEVRMAHFEKVKSEEITQTKLKYFTNISHDLLTPLTIISCLIEDIETTTREKLPQLSIMQSNVTRLKRLLQQILDFRKMEGGKMQLNIVNGDLTSFIRDICHTHFSPMRNKKNISFTFLSQHKEMPAFFDPDKVDKIIFNLLSNAFKYTPENGKIKVELSTTARNSHNYVQIKISDSGIGIATKELDLIFSRFYYNKTSSIKTNGIGLSLTKDLTILHKGEISVESQLHKGSAFTVEIPIDKKSYSDAEYHRDDAPENKCFEHDFNIKDNPEVLSTITNEQIKTCKDINILLVEDNLDLLQLVRNILSRHYTVFTATNGIEALAQVNNNDIDIIVSDVMMPEMDGFELCKALKENLETSHISIILLTAKNSINDRIECYNTGADAYISKPFELKVLEARINNFITQKQNRQKDFQSNIEINISTLEYPKLDEQFLNNAVKIIENNLSESEFDINSFAEHLNISKSSLYRKIKTMTGQSPIEFIRNIKLKHACQMLKQKNISISEVAYAVGFSDPKYFTSCFKTEFNMTPSDYQKSQNE